LFHIIKIMEPFATLS